MDGGLRKRENEPCLEKGGINQSTDIIDNIENGSYGMLLDIGTDKDK